jgi:hypothetical protein
MDRCDIALTIARTHSEDVSEQRLMVTRGPKKKNVIREWGQLNSEEIRT